MTYRIDLELVRWTAKMATVDIPGLAAARATPDGLILQARRVRPWPPAGPVALPGRLSDPTQPTSLNDEESSMAISGRIAVLPAGQTALAVRELRFPDPAGQVIVRQYASSVCPVQVPAMLG